MELPSISLILPVYNGEKYLSEALQSVADQEYPNLEVILIDDGSTDRSLEIARTFPMKIDIVQREHHGVYPARNWGIRKSRGAFLCLLDADDIMPTGNLKALGRYLVDHPEVDLVKGHLRRFMVEDGEHHPLGDWHDEPFCLSAMLFRRRVFDTVGMFAEDMKLGADADWHLRSVHLNVPTVVLPMHSLWYRIHESNSSKNIVEARKARMEVLRRQLARTRQGKPPTQPGPQA